MLQLEEIGKADAGFSPSKQMSDPSQCTSISISQAKPEATTAKRQMLCLPSTVVKLANAQTDQYCDAGHWNNGTRRKIGSNDLK